MSNVRHGRILRPALRRLFPLFLGILMMVSGFAVAQERSQPRHPVNEVILMPDRIMPPPQCACPIALTDYDVQTSIKDNVATTTITQVFKNESSQTLEAKYLYPLPQDANFSSFTLTVNGKALEGKIMEKDEARRTYQEIVRKLVDPGLLEYIDDKTVQVSVAPFFANETKKIQLSYTQLLQQDGGLYKYSYHLGNKGTTGFANGGRHGTPMTVQNLDLNLDLKTDQPLKTIYSPTHDPKITRSGNRQATVKLSLDPTQLKKEKSFVLYFSENNGELTLNSLNYKKPGEDGYFLLTVKAPDALADQEVIAKDVVLVLDTSGSMGGEKIKQAKEALKYIVNHLRAEDSFGLLQFNTDVSTFKNELIPANAANKKAALEYVDNLEAGGSTNIEAALNTGFAQLKNHNAQRPAYVIFLTDGEPTVGVTDTDGLVKVSEKANETYHAQLFNFGVGYDLNTQLLGKLADKNHGSTIYVEPDENLEVAMTGFYNKIEAPVLTDARLDFGDLQVSRMYPEKLGDLFVGSEVIVLGRHGKTGTGTVKLTGNVRGRQKNFSYPVNWDAGTTHGQLPRLWAGRRIAYLLENIQLNGENAELKNEVIALSKQYGIITPYTSFLSIEEKEYHRPGSRPDGRVLGGAGGASNFPAAAPMANQAAMDAASGRGAVQFQKAMKRMQTQASASELAEAQGVKGEDIALVTVENKTFLLSPDGVWTDTAYEEKLHGKPKQVTFGTEDYFRLLTEKPELLPFFSVGEQVLVVIDGVAYQVVAAKTG